MGELVQQFWQFASLLTIPSRDEGLIRFTEPWGTQRYFIDQLAEAIRQDKREVVVLKARQIGATTIGLAWDAFWCLKNPGLQGQFSANSDENRDYFRDVLTEMYKTLPPRYSYPLRANNKTQMAWANGSRLLFQTIGLKGKAGRGRGLNYHHGTEMGEWPGAEPVNSLRSAFSEKHPAALYLWEGTARGYNHFHDMWQDANRAITIHPVFLAWWRHDGYALETPSKAYRVYWDGRLTADERAWDRELRRRWGVELSPRQWAWRRWKLAEKMLGDEIMMHQEFPTLPEHAFQASGQPFLGHAAMARLREAVATMPEPEVYRYTFGGFIEQTEVHQTDPHLGHLAVWEAPRPHHHYVIAADPAYGASPQSDRSVCSVWRAGRTELVQVAAFASNEVTTQQFAWITCHLAGAYAPGHFILELNGPGVAVWQEIERLKSWGWGTGRRGEILDALGAINNYLYKRADSLSSGMNWQWKTTPTTKVWILNRLRDQILQGTVVAREPELIDELGHVRQAGEKFGTEGRTHDDRVIAAALAVEMWSGQVLPYLEVLPPAPEELPREAPPAHERALRRFFDRLQQPAVPR